MSKLKVSLIVYDHDVGLNNNNNNKINQWNNIIDYN